MTSVILRVWLVEDDPDERRFVRKALEGLDWRIELTEFPSGEDLMKGCLEGNLPHLVLLDLKMPRVSGREILERLRGDEAFTMVPVVVLTGSNAPPDIRRAWDGGCHGYFLKPADLVSYRTMLDSVFRYWFSSYSFANTLLSRP